MSQQKVDQKKYNKEHRKSIVRKRKIEEFLSLIVVLVIVVGVVGWVGYSIYDKTQQAAAENATYEYYDIDTAAIQDYLSDLTSAE